MGLLATNTAAGDLHVDGGAPCPGTGSVAAPFCSVQAALEAAADGDRVLVAPGVYPEAVDFLGKAVELVGVAGPARTVLESPDGSSVVTFASGEGPGSVLRGFTLRGGSGTPQLPLGERVGGGVYCVAAAPRITGNVIRDNGVGTGQGGGVYVAGGAPTIRRNLFLGNVAGQGGALGCSGGAPVVDGNRFEANGGPFTLGGAVHSSAVLTLVGNAFVGNEAEIGGAVLQDGGTLAATGNLFDGNVANLGGGGAVTAVFAAGGSVSGNVFSGNVAASRGGAVFTSFFTSVTWTDNLYEGNTAAEGGAVACTSGGFEVLDGEVFVGNVATAGSGAALLLEGGAAVARRCELRDHPGPGSTVLLRGATLEDSVVAGAVAARGAGPASGVELDGGVVRRCTVVGHAGAGLVAAAGHGQVGSSIVWGNGAPIVLAGGTLSVNWSTVTGGFPGPGNDGGDPLFVDAAAGEFALLPDSPAVDTGDPANQICGLDLSGGGRRVDGLLDGAARVDRGALEFSHVRLHVAAPARVDDPVRVETTGTAGLPVFVAVALAPAELCVEPWGTLLVDVTGPWWLESVGRNPVSTALGPWPGTSGLTLHLQAVATNPAMDLGATSNRQSVELP